MSTLLSGQRKRGVMMGLHRGMDYWTEKGWAHWGVAKALYVDLFEFE